MFLPLTHSETFSSLDLAAVDGDALQRLGAAAGLGVAER